MQSLTRTEFAQTILATPTEVLQSQAIMYGQHIMNYTDGNLDASLYILDGNYILFTTYYYDEYQETEVTMPNTLVLEFLLAGMELKRSPFDGNFVGIGLIDFSGEKDF